MGTRKLSHQEVAEIMMDASPLDELLVSLASVDAAILGATDPRVVDLYQDCRRGLLLHLESRERRGVPPEGVPYEASVEGRAVQAAVPSLRATVGEPVPAGRPSRPS